MKDYADEGLLRYCANERHSIAVEVFEGRNDEGVNNSFSKIYKNKF